MRIFSPGKSALITIAYMTACSLCAQGLTLSNGGVRKDFRLDDVYEAVFSEFHDPDDDCNCRFSTVIGRIASVSPDSVRFVIHEVVHRNYTGEMRVENQVFNINTAAVTSFPREDLLYLQHYRSLKSKKAKEGFTGAGVLLIFTGIATSLSALAARDKKSRGHVALAGGAQVGLGILFVAVSSTRKYYVSGGGDVWSIE
jgi:hypothetical protein